MRSMSEVIGKGILCSIWEKLGSFNLQVQEILAAEKKQEKGTNFKKKSYVTKGLSF